MFYHVIADLIRNLGIDYKDSERLSYSKGLRIKSAMTEFKSPQ